MKMLVLLPALALAAVGFAQSDPSFGKTDESFLREANMMLLRSEGKEPCDMTSADKAVVKGGAGCCSAPGAKMLYKVFVAGQGYQKFSCPDEAGKARKEWLAKGKRVGAVQKIAQK